MKEKIELYFSKDTSTCWDENSLYNSMFLARADYYAKEWIRIRGFIFLGEIKEHLGIKAVAEDWKFIAKAVDDWSFGCMPMEEDGVTRITILMDKVE